MSTFIITVLTENTAKKTKILCDVLMHWKANIYIFRLPSNVSNMSVKWFAQLPIVVVICCCCCCCHHFCCHFSCLLELHVKVIRGLKKTATKHIMSDAFCHIQTYSRTTFSLSFIRQTFNLRETPIFVFFLVPSTLHRKSYLIRCTPHSSHRNLSIRKILISLQFISVRFFFAPTSHSHSKK